LRADWEGARGKNLGGIALTQSALFSFNSKRGAMSPKKTTAKTAGRSTKGQFVVGGPNPGGTKGNPGGGRPPDWLKQKCREIVEKKKLIEWLGDVAAGEDVDQQINAAGECLKIPASVKDRLKAIEMLEDRGWGKPTQEIESSSLQEVIDLMRKKYA
jgi:hypothetical protein